MKGKVVSVNASDRKGIVKAPVEKGVFETGFGLKGDAHGGDWHRQVSLLDIESIKKMENKTGKELPYGTFAENLTTEGVTLYTLPVGAKFSIGNAKFEVTQIGKECHTSCAIGAAVGSCVMPKEGIFAIVLQNGTVQAGDEIVFEEC